MIKAENTETDFEILLSTMNRTSFSFLEEMFPNDTHLNYNILIINQISKGKNLKSEFNNIRIINSYEKGLSRSRNLAMGNAKGSICLFADDDVKYKSGFKEIILNAFKVYDDAGVVTFQMTDDKGELFKEYPNVVKHNKRTINTVNSVVIALNRKKVIENNIFFNKNFGLGSTFETADEYIFLRSVLRKEMKIYFEPKILLEHPNFSSGSAVASDKILYARSAVFYKYNGVITYLKLGWYLFLLIKNNKIKSNQFIKKYKQGLKGIKEYKSLLNKGVETIES